MEPENATDPHPKKGNTHLWVVKLQTFFMFTPEIGEDEPLLTTVIFFKRGLNQTTNQTSTRSTKFFGELPNRKLLRKGLGTTPRCLGCQWPFWWSGGALRCLSDPPVVKVMKSMFWTWSKGTLPKTYRGGIILKELCCFFWEVSLRWWWHSEICELGFQKAMSISQLHVYRRIFLHERWTNIEQRNRWSLYKRVSWLVSLLASDQSA